jgi:hypothetical protein
MGTEIVELGGGGVCGCLPKSATTRCVSSRNGIGE